MIRALIAAACLAGLSWPAVAQTPAPAKPDSPAVVALLEKAKKTAGTTWADEFHFFCEAPRPNRPDDPPIAATRIFDDVFAIGNSGTTVYLIRTSAGLVLIDALAANQLETQLLPGLQALGFDPAEIKHIIVGHGHADHFGGAAHLQERHGARVYVSAADWDLMANPPAGRGGPPATPPPAPPKRDRIITDGQPIVIGDLTVTPVAIPGHTAGSMGYIFPVRDKGRQHMAALYGGTILTANIISDEGLRTYIASVARFKEATKRARVDVEIQNHPLMDPIQVKLDRLKTRANGQPHPFVVGRGNYQKFLDVMSLCMQAELQRRQ